MSGSAVYPADAPEEMKEEHVVETHGTPGVGDWLKNLFTRRFLWVIVIMEAIMIALYYLYVDYNPVDTDALQFALKYPAFQDVHVMVYVGFGFLMTFLARYSWSAVGLTFLLATMAVQWGILCRNFFEFLIVEGDFKHNIFLNVEQLILAEFVAASFLISYGAVLGVFSPTQLLCMMFLHAPGYALVEAIAVELKGVDPGGSMILHLYGAVFGLAVSFVSGFWRKATCGEPSSGKIHGLFSMIGTLFLFLYWPSFNSAIAAHQERAVIITYLALGGSTAATFLTSFAFRHGGIMKFDIEDVQNATLSGAVAVGAACDFFINPPAGLVIGIVTGFISTLSFVYLSPFLKRVIGLRDTCGVLNLHAIPGFIGGICSCLAAWAVANRSGLAADGRSNIEQAGVQLAITGIALGIALVWGGFTGLVIRIPWFWEETKTELYNDSANWIVGEEVTGHENIVVEKQAAAAL